jgi:hypothetical protein
MLVKLIDVINASVSAGLPVQESFLSMLSSNFTLKSPRSIVGHLQVLASILALLIKSKVWPVVSDDGI